MSKLLKIGLTLVALVIALLVLVVIRVLTLDPNNYKDWIADRFQEQTGLSLTISGDISLELYPWLDLSVAGVNVGNAPGFGEQPLLQADNARLRVKLLPALRQRFEIDTVQLHGVRVNLVVNESGTGNWASLAGDSGGQAAGSATDGGLPLTSFIIGGVDVADVSLRYEDLRNATYYEVSDLAFNIDQLVYGTPLELSLTLNAATNQPVLQSRVNLSGTVIYDIDNGRYQLAPLSLQANLVGETLPNGGADISLSGSVDVDLDADTLTVDNLSVSGLDAGLEATLRGRNISTDRSNITADIAVNGNDLATLFRAAGVEAMARQLAEVRNRGFGLDVTATFDGGADSIEVSSLAASLLGAELSGTLSVSELSSQQPVIRGDMNASGPDLPLLVEVVGQMSGGTDSAISQAGRELRQAPQRQFDVSANFDADLGDGVISVPTLDASLLGATIRGELSAEGIQSQEPVIRGNLNASGPDLPLFLRLGGRLQGGTESALYQFADRLRSAGNRAFSVDARFDADLEQGNINVPVLVASALGLQLEGAVDARNINGRNGAIDGSLNLQSSAAGDLLVALDQAELAEILERLSVNVKLSGNRADLVIEPLHADIVVGGPRIPNSPATLSLDAASRLNLDRDTLDLDSFSVSGLGLDFSGRLSAERLTENPTYQGQVQLAEFNLRRFLEQMNQPLPATSDPTVLQRVGAATAFSGSTDAIALRELNLVLDDTTLQGNLAVNSFTDLGAEFDIRIDSIDADRYLPPAETQAVASGTTGESSEIPVEQLRQLSLQGKLQIGELTLSGLELAALSVAVNAGDGELELAPLSAELYEGSFSGSASLSVSGAQPQARLQSNLNGVDLEPLLFDLLNATYVTGTGNIRLAINGSGSNTDAIRNSLTGTGRMELQDGILSGVDVSSVLRQLETMIRRRQAGALQRGEQTAFDSFAATLAIENGVIRSNDLLIKSPGFQVTGRGTLLNLADNSIAFDLETSVDRSTATVDAEEYDIGGYDLPIACTGTLSSPRCLPDAGEILRARVQRELQDRVTDLLDRAIGIEPDEPADSTGADQQPETEQPQQTPQQQEPQDIRDQLINRALDRIFN